MVESQKNKNNNQFYAICTIVTGLEYSFFLNHSQGMLGVNHISNVYFVQLFKINTNLRHMFSLLLLRTR
jgi:hypothetical protein